MKALLAISLKLLIFLLTFLIISCAGKEIQNSNSQHPISQDDDLIIYVRSSPILEKIRENIQLICFRYSNEKTFDHQIFTRRCSAFMRDYGYASILLDDYNGNIFREYNDKLDKLALATVSVIEKTEGTAELQIIIYCTNQSRIEGSEDAEFLPAWMGAAIGKSITFSSKNKREEIAHYLIQCYAENILHEKSHYKFQKLKY